MSWLFWKRSRKLKSNRKLNRVRERVAKRKSTLGIQTGKLQRDFVPIIFRADEKPLSQGASPLSSLICSSSKPQWHLSSFEFPKSAAQHEAILYLLMIDQKIILVVKYDLILEFIYI